MELKLKGNSLSDLHIGGLEKDRLVFDAERTPLRELNLRIRREYVPAS